MRTLARITTSILWLALAAATAGQDTRSMFAAGNRFTVSGTPATRSASSIEFAGATATLPFTVSVTSGQLILYAAAIASSSSISVTDNCAAGGASNSYTQIQGTVSGAAAATAGWARASATSASCTVTFSLTSSKISAALDIVNDSGSGVDVSQAQFQTNIGTGTNAVTSGTVSTTHSNDYCWGFTADVNSNGGTISAGTLPIAYTQHTLNSNMPAAEEDGVLAAVGSAAGTFTHTTTTNKQGTTMVCVLPH